MDSVDMSEQPSSQQLEVTDPGHVTHKFSCATGGGDVDGDGERVKRFEFALETSVGPSIFHHTKASLKSPKSQAGICRTDLWQCSLIPLPPFC